MAQVSLNKIIYVNIKMCIKALKYGNNIEIVNGCYTHVHKF